MTQGKPIDENETPTPDADGPPGETLAERSARLEAEAASGNYDPLAPEEIPEQAEETEQTSQEDNNSPALEALQNELDTTKDQLMRALAEAENTRRRAQREREDATKFAVTGFSKDLLSVADNLRRALEAVPEDLLEADVRVKNLLEGIEATERELIRTFEKNGIQKLEPVDEVFDPNFHEVMFETPGTGKPPGTITQVVEIGYTLNDRLLRPARVGVAKDDGNANTSGNEGSPGGTLDTEA